MRVESIPLYDLYDRLLGWSVYLVFGDVDEDLRPDLPKRTDRGVESWDDPRDRETHVWYFRPCPADRLETL